MNDKVSAALSNHVSSLLAQQNHVVHLCIDMKIASRVINPHRACSKNSLCCDMSLIFSRPDGSQMFRSGQFFYEYQSVSNVGEQGQITELPVK